MEGLTRLDSSVTPAAVALALASSVRKIHEREFQITLKKNVAWSDGRELLAKDFIDSWNAVFKRCWNVPVALRMFCDLRVWKARAVSAYEIRIHFTRSVPRFDHALTHPVFWPRRMDRKTERLTLGMYQPNPESSDSYILNPYYHGTPSVIERIDFIHAPTQEARIGLFREGSVDVVDDLVSETAGRLKSDPELVLAASTQRTYVSFEHWPALTEKVRKALTDSIDRKEIASLNQLIALPVAEDENPAPPQLDAAPRIHIEWDFKPDLEKTARGLGAQWTKKLKAAVTLAPRRTKRVQLAPGTLVAHVFIRNETGFEPDALPQTSAIPLFQSARAALKSPRIDTLVPCAFGGWSFAFLKWR